MNGFNFFKNYLSVELQKKALEAIDLILDECPPFTNTMWNGQPFKVINANAGLYGWVSDPTGYRYQSFHPDTKQNWPTIPDIILQITKELTDKAGFGGFKPECCYVNFYSKDAFLGIHRDDTEDNLSAPIVSISLGDTAWFYLGGLTKEDKKQRIILESGDCYVQGGESRNYYHSIKKILPKTSNLLPDGGRVNLTVRQIK